ncbi:MAG TPA: LPS assembly protein LptD [Vicinamibacteria bacterium]|nr:LPS assembly protein LptD [Vicinamibacteria bacterium]
MRSLFIIPALVASLVPVVCAVAAEPTDPQIGPAPKKAKPKRPPPEPGEGLPPGEFRLRADTQEEVSKGHYQARGFVDLRTSDARLQADRLDLYETENADGTKSRRAVAEGNVVFMRGEERIAGDRLEMDMDSGEGTFENALGFVEPGVFVEGRKIFRLDAKTYRVEDGKFTSCAQPNPRWMFSASSARIEVNDKIVATNAIFRVKSFPAFYLPVIVYPIRQDQRSTGFLLPHFGYSTFRGFNVGDGFFWAMGRSADQTFSFDNYSSYGKGFGHEFRYLEDAPSRGTLHSYFFLPQGSTQWDYNLDWNALQMLPGKFQATLSLQVYSSQAFQEQSQDNFNLATSRSTHRALTLQRNFGSTVFLVSADTTDTFFGDTAVVNRHLPGISLRRLPQQIGGGFIFGYEARADGLGYGNDQTVDSYFRFDLAPEVSRPLSLSFLQVTPTARFRFTRYSATLASSDSTGTGPTAITGPARDRPLFEGTVDLRGPTFSRVFGDVSDPGRFKHVIGPEITWTYRTPVTDFNSIPKFDGADYLLGTDQITYALVQRILTKRPGPTGKLVSNEFFSWRLAQTYYVQIAEGQNNFDPNYSSSAFGPGFQPEHLSPLLSRMRIRPNPNLSGDFNLEYDVNFKQLRTIGLTSSVGGAWGNLQAGWSRSVRLSDNPADRVVAADWLRGGIHLEPVARIGVDASANYDLVQNVWVQLLGRVRYEVQCCGFVAEYLKYNYNSRVDSQFRFQIELANVGSIGNFNGDDVAARRAGLAGYR